MSRLVEPVLLSLLARDKARYGYEIMEQANREALTDSEIDAAVVYRTLRTLEDAGCVQSEWQPGDGGPHRRMYQITQVGREHLEDWLSVLGRHSERLASFVQQHRTE
jgi:PadR family transcriptional regulator PadR